MEEVAPNVYVESGFERVTVGAILTEAGWVCIDTPTFPHEARSWQASLHAIADRPVRYVIQTDHHRDRVLCNGFFDAPVILHEAAARLLLALKSTFVSQAAEDLSTNDNELVDIASLRLIPPQVSFTTSSFLECGDRAITLVSKPSAAGGSLWVVLSDERVLFAGDCTMVDRHPFIDGGDTKHWLEILGEFRRGRYDGWIIVPGRGDIIRDASRLEVLADYIRVARRRVNSLVRAERPRAELAQIIPELFAMFPLHDADREEVYRRIKLGLETIYEELSSRGDPEEDGE